MERQDEEVCWESKPSPPLYGTVYNGNTDDYARIDNLYPTFVLTRVRLLEETVTVAGTTIDKQFSRCVSARFPWFLVYVSCWSRDQDGSWTTSRLCES